MLKYAASLLILATAIALAPQAKASPKVGGIVPNMGTFSTVDLSARRHHHRYHKRVVHRRGKHRVVDANGNRAMTKVVSHKTGATATVSAAFAVKAQAYIDDIEQNYGAKVLFMGGIRPGPCHSGSLHPCGRALDVCQYKRGVVEDKCNLPGRVALGAIALKHGLFEGGMWCNQDYGHVQDGVSAVPCANNILAAVRKFKLAAGLEEGTDPEAKAWVEGEALKDVDSKTQLDNFKSLRTASARARVRTASYRRHRVAYRRRHYQVAQQAYPQYPQYTQYTQQVVAHRARRYRVAHHI